MMKKVEIERFLIISVGKYEATIIFPFFISFFYFLEEIIRQIVKPTRMTENLKKAYCLFSLYEEGWIC